MKQMLIRSTRRNPRSWMSADAPVHKRIAEHVSRLEGICQKCLEVDQDQRYVNVGRVIVKVDGRLVPVKRLRFWIEAMGETN